MFVGDACGDPPPGGSLEITFLDEIGFVNILEGGFLLPDGRRQIVYSHRTALELVDERQQNRPIHLIESPMINLQQGQGRQGHLPVYQSPGLNLGLIPDTAEKAVGDPRGSPGAACHLLRPLLVDLHSQDLRRSPDDHRQFLGIVKIEPEAHPEPIAEGRGK